jgi:hypothetical protein
MKQGIYFRMEVALAETSAWEKSVLAEQLDKLREVEGFDGLDMGDDDLLGGEITVKGQTTKEGALEFLEQSGLDADSDAEIEATATEIDGEPAITLFSKGPLARDASVADLLAYLTAAADEATEVIREGGIVVARGFLSDYDAYRSYRLPIVYSVGAARDHGAAGRVTFFGESDGEFVATLVDSDGTDIEIREPDPQNMTEDDWNDRLPDLEAIDALASGWIKKKKR